MAEYICTHVFTHVGCAALCAVFRPVVISVLSWGNPHSWLFHRIHKGRVFKTSWKICIVKKNAWISKCFCTKINVFLFLKRDVYII